MTENKHTIDSLLARMKHALEEEGIEPELIRREGQALLAARPYGQDSPLTVLVQISDRVEVPARARAIERTAGRLADDIGSRPTLDRRSASDIAGAPGRTE